MFDMTGFVVMHMEIFALYKKEEMQKRTNIIAYSEICLQAKLTSFV